VSTVGDPGTQGATRAGTHGMGVNTPSAAAVAAMTVGLAILWHMPKVGTLANGRLLMMVPTGICTRTMAAGMTLSGTGAMPKEQLRMAVLVQAWLMVTARR